jgi:hypothetical protein
VRTGGPRVESLPNLYFGLHYAVVCQNKDPDQLDRIKVRLPWLDHGDEDQTHWAQLLKPMEGDRLGWYTLPDIDDVVVVMFVGGDVSQPVIVGGVWSKADFAPEPNQDGANNFRGYRSRTGHRLILDDSAQVKVVLADKTATNVLGVGQFAKAGAGPNACAVYKPPMSAATGVALSTMEGKLELSCPDGALLVVADDSIKISSKTSIDVVAGSQLELDGTSETKLHSDGASSYDASIVNVA